MYVMSKSVKRLFEQFKPKHYLIDIKVDTDKNTFSGAVIINGQKSGRPSQRLTLHQNGLKVTGAHLTKHDKKGDSNITIDRINLHNSFDEVRLHAKDMLYPGNYTVRLEFSGKITNQMNGLYPCFFKDEGVEKRLFATQFESHHAREVFPCIDEPEAKAVFELSLTHPADVTVLSNTPIAKQSKVTSHQSSVTRKKSDGQETEDKRLTTTFEPTPHMSTYLLAFVFGELGFLEAKTKSGTVVRTYATKANVELTDFALDIAVKCLEFYEDYFGIAYPLEKCDLIALPDFASGAMENWGCITFREQALLVDPKNSTLSTKQYVALVVAHELAHQWFGNLVTMRWWTDLWLNEGFASWIEYLATDHLFPDWDVWTQFIVDEQQQALKLDALENTHPIEVPVNHPDEIRTIFDAISYSKGASVINMLHKYLGADDFKVGLREYLAKHKYSNTNTVDLWESLEEVSGKPVREFMHAWTATPGFPLLEVNVNEKGVHVSQKRFFTNPNHEELPEQSWPIPLLHHAKGYPSSLNKTSDHYDHIASTDLKFNLGQNGFYRTTYNATHLQTLGHAIDKGKLSNTDRLGLLNDLFEASKAGLNDTAIALHFLKHFTSEHDYPVWDSIAAALGGLRLVMGDDELRENMKPYIRNLVAAQLERLGWDAPATEPHFDKLLRPIILGLASSADEPTIVKHCLKLFDRISEAEDVAPQLRETTTRSRMKRGVDIDPDLRGTVFGTVARLGGQAEFDKLVKMHHSSLLTEEKTTLAAAITGFRQPKQYKQALELISSKEVRLQDVSYWIAYSFLNRHARKDTWLWLKDNWDWLDKNMGSDLSFYRMPIYAARVFSDESFIHEYKEFFLPKMSPALDRSYKQGLEMIQWQSAWKKRSIDEVKTFFAAQK